MTYRIGVDARMVQHTGIGTYLRGLLDGVRGHKSDLADIRLFGSAHVKKRYPEIDYTRFDAPIYSVKEQLQYSSHLRQCELWHAPHYNVPYFKGNTKLIVTIHDIIHWIFRKEFLTPLQSLYASAMLNRAVTNANHILTVSENTKEDLVQYFNADPDRITVIYEGVSSQFSKIQNQELISRVLTKYKISQPYFLYVGLMKPHKNLPWLIRNYQQLRRAGKTQSLLVLVGKPEAKYPAGFEIMTKINELDGVIHLDRVEAEELTVLYSEAQALVHPSKYEGFGLTLLESMACQTPVIASRTASIPEVVGEGGLLVDPANDEQLCTAMLQIETDPELRKDMAQRGLMQIQKFSWDAMANQTMNIYEKVLTTS